MVLGEISSCDIWKTLPSWNVTHEICCAVPIKWIDSLWQKNTEGKKYWFKRFWMAGENSLASLGLLEKKNRFFALRKGLSWFWSMYRIYWGDYQGLETKRINKFGSFEEINTTIWPCGDFWKTLPPRNVKC